MVWEVREIIDNSVDQHLTVAIFPTTIRFYVHWMCHKGINFKALSP
jgi:hypothetical protein